MIAADEKSGETSTVYETAEKTRNLTGRRGRTEPIAVKQRACVETSPELRREFLSGEGTHSEAAATEQ